MTDFPEDFMLEAWRREEGIKTVDDERKVKIRDILNRCVLKPNGLEELRNVL